jgi:Transcription factor S-II (TFIIS), central domain
MHLKDDKNLELRRKVLTKDFTAHDLVYRDEKDFFNPDQRRETIERHKLNFDLDHKPPPST